jgi:hypothetical protein
MKKAHQEHIDNSGDVVAGRPVVGQSQRLEPYASLRVGAPCSRQFPTFGSGRYRLRQIAAGEIEFGRSP